MKLKKGIIVGAVVCAVLGNVMNVSAAELDSGAYAKTLIKNQQDSLIIDVEAYKAAYDDLAKAFGNNSYAYVNHYLTVGVYEGRTKGVLFDPLIYADSYSDVKGTYGYDIQAIVEHYINFGIAENRTQGTAQGYTDIAAAEKAGVQNTNINRNIAKSAGSGTITGADIANSSVTNYDASDESSSLDGGNAASSGTANSVYVENNSVTNYNSSSENNSLSSSHEASVSGSIQDSNVPAASNDAAANENNSSAGAGNDYHHTTSIYDNDESTLLRVEYYNDDNQLIKYSSVTDFDSSTNSYKEEIYHYDETIQSSVLERTDVYENGVLSSSTTP